MTNSTPPNPPTPAVDQPEMLLDQALENLRRESESLTAPPHIEKQLMAAFASAHHVALSRKQQDVRRRRVTHFFGQWFAPGVAIAASVGMASWMMVSPLSKAGNEAAADVLAIAAEITFADDGSNPFIALQSLERIALEPTPRQIGRASCRERVLASV